GRLWKHPLANDFESKVGGVGTVWLRSAESETNRSRDQIRSRLSSVAAVSTRRYKIDEDLLKLFKKVGINIPLLDAIKQIPKYAKFLKELYIHKRKKMKGAVETEESCWH
ncbi:hypothetical protein CR513_60990, partial [Mucuna pruriens]